MGFQWQRNRLVVVAILLTFLSGSLLIWISYWNTKGIGSDLRTASNQSAIQHAVKQLAADLDVINSIFLQLENTDYIDYARSNNNLRSTEAAEQSRSELIQRLEKLQLPAGLIEQIYFIGTNVNQKNFGLYAADRSLIPESEIPWIEDFEKSNLLNDFIRYYGMPAYIPQGAFTSMLQASQRITEEQRNRLDVFYRRLEGNLVIHNGVNNLNVLVVLVINQAIFERMLPNGQAWSGHVGILDSDHHVMWTNLDDRGVMEQAQQQLSQGATAWKPEKGDIREVRLELVSPYGLNLLFFERKADDAIWSQNVLKWSVVVLLATLLISFAVSMKFANLIMHPYRLLSRIWQHKKNDEAVQVIQEERFRALPLSRMSIRNKVLLLLAASVMLPFISAVAMHGVFIYQFVFNKSVQATTLVSDQVVGELRNRMDEYENLINGIAADSRLSRLFASRGYGLNYSDEFPMTYYAGIGKVAYFVLYNSQGAARYSSVFVHNLTLFKFPLADAALASSLKTDEIVWLTGAKDVYNHASLMLVKKISLRLSADKAPQDAYLQLVLREDAFQTSAMERQMRFVILDERNMAVYASETSSATAESDDLAKSGSSNHAIVQRDIPESGWHMMLIFNIDDIYLKISGMFYRYLLLVVMTMLLVLVVVWLLSLYLVRPIEALKQVLERGDLPGGDEPTALQRDEIGLLVRSFNSMVGRINELMEENVNKQVREKELLASRMQARLGMLQQQINPHFLYNTLEAINMRASQYGATEVSVMVNSLAKIFRFTINTGSETVLVSEELQHVNNYLTIQSIRFQHAFAIRWDVDEQAASHRILKFILQPIVENALQHGLDGAYEQGELLIRVKLTDKHTLLLEVSDNGFGMSKPVLEELLRSLQDEQEPGKRAGSYENGVGLKNVYQRLKIYYGQPFEMIVESEEFVGTRVLLHIPIDRQDDAAGRDEEG